MLSNTRYYDRVGAPRQLTEERAAAGTGEILFGLVVERRSAPLRLLSTPADAKTAKKTHPYRTRSSRKTSETQSRS